MSLVVEQQDEVINVIETQAAGVEKDTEAGYVIHLISCLCGVSIFLDCNIQRRL
jgi:hypothetical protein